MPVCEAFAEELKDFFLAGEVGLVWGGVAAVAFGIDPANAIKAFLKDIAGAWNDVLIRPAAQSINSSKGFDRPRSGCIKRIDDAAVDDGRTLLLLIEFEFLLGDFAHFRMEAI